MVSTEFKYVPHQQRQTLPSLLYKYLFLFHACLKYYTVYATEHRVVGADDPCLSQAQTWSPCWQPPSGPSSPPPPPPPTQDPFPPRQQGRHLKTFLL